MSSPFPPPAQFPPEYLTESRTASILIANIFLQAVSTVFITGRVISRAYLLHQFASDDYLLVVGWLLGTGVSITAYLSVHYGLGHHVVAFPQEDIQRLQIAGFAGQLLFILVLPVIKLSMCISYRRVFHSNKISRMILTTVIVLLVLSGIAFEVVSIFQCNPISDFWNSATRQTCLNIQPAFYLNGVSNLITDVLLILIVIPQVLQLKMHRRQKSILIAIVSLGWLAVIAGIVRMVRVSRLFGPTIDPSWDSFDIVIWTAVEVHVSLFCAAAPSIRPLVVRLMPRLLGSSFGSSMTSQSQKRSSHLLLESRKSAVTVRSRPIHTATDRVPGARDSWMALHDDDGSLELASVEHPKPVR